MTDVKELTQGVIDVKMMMARLPISISQNAHLQSKLDDVTAALTHLSEQNAAKDKEIAELKAKKAPRTRTKLEKASQYHASLVWEKAQYVGNNRPVPSGMNEAIDKAILKVKALSLSEEET